MIFEPSFERCNINASPVHDVCPTLALQDQEDFGGFVEGSYNELWRNDTFSNRMLRRHVPASLISFFLPASCVYRDSSAFEERLVDVAHIHIDYFTGPVTLKLHIVCVVNHASVIGCVREAA